MADVEYRLNKRMECEACGGTGMRAHPRWFEFDEWMATTGHSPMDRDGLRACQMWWSARGFDSPPEREIECDECAGMGEFSELVSLREALVDLGFLIETKEQPCS